MRETAPCSNIDRFDRKLRKTDYHPLEKQDISVLQINLGDKCNQACIHCHISASPTGRREMVELAAERLVALARASSGIKTVDLTGGAPEMNRCFEYLVTHMRAMGKRVIDRCNLTVLFEEGLEKIPTILKENQVEIVASLPCYTEQNVDTQRGRGAFKASIGALKKLNRLGYGIDNDLPLTLVFNPGGDFLPGTREQLERDYKTRLEADFGVRFTRLQTMINMPLGRFKGLLQAEEKLDAYMNLLDDSFNQQTLGGVMCRNLVSVFYDGSIFDCDFNLAEGLAVSDASGKALTIFDIDNFSELEGRPIITDAHCLGCTGGTGSGCFGELVRPE